MKRKQFIVKTIGVMSFFMATLSYAGIPLWTFTPLTATTITVPSNATAIVQYIVTNQSDRAHTLMMSPIPAITQLTTGPGICASTFVLPSKESSCVLSLEIHGDQLTHRITDGPIVCQQGNPNQCYRPSSSDLLNITPE